MEAAGGVAPDRDEGAVRGLLAKAVEAGREAAARTQAHAAPGAAEDAPIHPTGEAAARRLGIPSTR